jgi:uncharacterized protein (DUF1697 family)
MLRGINLGPRRRVPMAGLRELLTEAGYANVRTYVQSGNIVLESPAAAVKVERSLTELISDRFGFDVPVLVRSRAQLAAVVKANPLGEVANNEKRYVVTFLSVKPTADVMHKLEELARDNEAVAVSGRELYTWHPEGQARSKLAAALTAKELGVNATARNWTTVRTLLDMASA